MSFTKVNAASDFLEATNIAPTAVFDEVESELTVSKCLKWFVALSVGIAAIVGFIVAAWVLSNQTDTESEVSSEFLQETNPNEKWTCDMISTFSQPASPIDFSRTIEDVSISSRDGFFPIYRQLLSDGSFVDVEKSTKDTSTLPFAPR